MKYLHAFLLIMSMTVASTQDCLASQRISARLSQEYITIGKLFEICKEYGKCSTPSECDGQTALVRGAIDYNNVFNRSRYLQLPYEKFFVVSGGKTLDVFVVTSDNASLFEKIYAAREVGQKEAFIKGTVRSFDASIMGVCRKAIRFEILSPKDIYFK